MTERTMRLRTAMVARKASKERVDPADQERIRVRVVSNAHQRTHASLPSQMPPYYGGTVEDYLLYWLHTYKRGTLKPTSYDTLERVMLAYINPRIGSMRLTDVTADVVQNLVNDLKEEGYSHSTVKKVHDCLGASLRHAWVRKYIPDNPILLVEMPAQALFETKEVSFFTIQECSLLIEEAQKEYSTGRRVYVYGDAIILIMLTGIRLGEAVGLRKSDYDAERKTLKVRRNIHKVRNRDGDGNLLPGRQLKESTTKSYSGTREIPLTSLAVQIVERLLLEYPFCESLICNTKGTMATPEQIDRTFRYLLRNVGLECSGVHKLRHTFATILFGSKKVDIKTISKLLGHASPTITLCVYTHIADQIPHSAVTPLDELF